MTRIARRDFVGGMAMGLAAGTAMSPMQAVGRGLLPASALGADYYPPALTGMRGTHDGAFEVAHPLWDPPEYDAYADVGPHVVGRARMNRISIANSDAGAVPLMQVAFEQGHRAAREQLEVA